MLKLAILGYPVHHTLSPVLQGFFMEQLGLRGDYDVYEVRPDKLGELVQDLTKAGMTGWNVTIPHKVAMLDLVDTVSASARLVQSINTVVVRDGKTEGYNTDVMGFLGGLPEDDLVNLPNTHALVVGNGGAARAVLAALIGKQTAQITVASRNPEKAEALLAIAQQAILQTGAKTRLYSVGLDALLHLAPYPLVVNTTPVGMVPDTDASPLDTGLLATLPGNALVYDLIYRPEITRLLATAQDLDKRIQSGLDMLIYQGAEAFRLWSGKSVPPELIPGARDLLRERLRDSTSFSR